MEKSVATSVSKHFLASVHWEMLSRTTNRFIWHQKTKILIVDFKDAWRSLIVFSTWRAICTIVMEFLLSKFRQLPKPSRQLKTKPSTMSKDNMPVHWKTWNIKNFVKLQLWRESREEYIYVIILIWRAILVLLVSIFKQQFTTFIFEIRWRIGQSYQWQGSTNRRSCWHWLASYEFLCTQN